jgi:MYXO-CTERM domain-containing protein
MKYAQRSNEHAACGRASRTSLRHGLAVSVFTCALAFAGPASAYSDPDRFGMDTALGGSDGRYFTGSPVDGFGCDVCHSGGDEPTGIVIRNLPVTGYVKGTTYDVEIALPESIKSTGIQLEFIGRDGRAAGTVSLPDESAVDARSRCGGSADEAVASYVTELPDEGRTIVGLRACDAKALRFRFTAPDTADLTFSGGIVSSDDSATVTGDGYASLNRILYRQGEAAAKSTSSCAISPSAGGAEKFGFFWLALATAALLLRRRH